MYKILAKLKSFFSRKPKVIEQPAAPVEAAPPVPVAEITPVTDAPAEEFRKQVPCSYCGAPNDPFVKICWMCKKEFRAKIGNN